MALKLGLTANNGITTEYHRIESLNIRTNQQNLIMIYSYLNEEARKLELESCSTGGEITYSPYIEVQEITADYDENMSIESAYEYLKTLPEFEGAEDV